MSDSERIANIEKLVLQQGKVLQTLTEIVSAQAKVLQCHSLALQQLAEQTFGKPQEVGRA